MPTDPRLVPTSQDPQARLMERLAQFEGRLRQIEMAKDVVPTMVEITDGPTSMNYVWRGGRAWFIAGLQVGTTGFGGSTILVNGVTLGSGSSPTSDNFGKILARDMTSLLVPGNNTIERTLFSGAFSGIWGGLILEWGVA